VRRRARRTVAAGVAAWLVACAPLPSSAPLAPPLTDPSAIAAHRIDGSGRSARRFAVAAAIPLATEAGYRVLGVGGSAVDAAVAVQMVLTLVEPQSSVDAEGRATR
jgi:gamma-glutamyltranspeptidase/glutathione hydrolase